MTVGRARRTDRAASTVRGLSALPSTTRPPAHPHGGAQRNVGKPAYSGQDGWEVVIVVSGSTRVGWLDSLRGVAILLVVVLHAGEALRVAVGPTPGLDQVNLFLEPFRMPVLMFLSGFLLPQSLAGRTFRHEITGAEIRPTIAGDQAWLFLGQLFEHVPVGILRGSGAEAPALPPGRSDTERRTHALILPSRPGRGPPGRPSMRCTLATA